jgi:TRAP-type C4-dicarboxylate transport system permease small subunit
MLGRLQNRYKRIIEHVSELLAVASGFFLIVMIVLCCYGIFTRYLLRSPAAWTLELPSFLFLAITAFALARAERLNAHVSVEIFTMKLSIRMRNTIGIVNDSIFLLYAMALLWATIRKCMISLEQNVNSVDIGFPLYIVYLAGALGFGALVLQILAEIGKKIDLIRDGKS